jgi:hypothetical protein
LLGTGSLGDTLPGLIRARPSLVVALRSAWMGAVGMGAVGMWGLGSALAGEPAPVCIMCTKSWLHGWVTAEMPEASGGWRALPRAGIEPE